MSQKNSLFFPSSMVGSQAELQNELVEKHFLQTCLTLWRTHSFNCNGIYVMVNLSVNCFRGHGIKPGLSGFISFTFCSLDCMPCFVTFQQYILFVTGEEPGAVSTVSRHHVTIPPGTQDDAELLQHRQRETLYERGDLYSDKTTITCLHLNTEFCRHYWF